MNTDFEQNIVYACKCIYYSTNITIYAFHNEDLIYISKRLAPMSEKIIYDKYPTISVLDKNTKYQIIKNNYQENFYIVSFKDDGILIIIGPFLNEQINEGMLTNMIRKGLIPFHKRSEMSEFYKSLRILNEDQVFYTSKLIENIFDNIKQNKEVKNIDTFNDINKMDDFYENLKNNRIESFSHSSYANEQKISETIKIGDKENAKRILKEINLTPHAKLAVDEIRSYKNSMICSCTFMTRAAISGGVNPDQAFTLSDTYINRIENIQNLNDLENFEAIMVEGFTDLVNNIKTNKYSRSILNAINYIDKHLCEDLKIKDIAKASYLNPSYLSNLFHKETNMTISDWILNKRINEAAFSIINTNEEIADIAFFYHFCSQSYFVKCFKKIMGVTPGEYRNNHNSK